MKTGAGLAKQEPALQNSLIKQNVHLYFVGKRKGCRQTADQCSDSFGSTNRTPAGPKAAPTALGAPTTTAAGTSLTTPSTSSEVSSPTNNTQELKTTLFLSDVRTKDDRKSSDQAVRFSAGSQEVGDIAELVVLLEAAQKPEIPPQQNTRPEFGQRLRKKEDQINKQIGDSLSVTKMFVRENVTSPFEPTEEMEKDAREFDPFKEDRGSLEAFILAGDQSEKLVLMDERTAGNSTATRRPETGNASAETGNATTETGNASVETGKTMTERRNRTTETGSASVETENASIETENIPTEIGNATASATTESTAATTATEAAAALLDMTTTAALTPAQLATLLSLTVEQQEQLLTNLSNVPAVANMTAAERSVVAKLLQLEQLRAEQQTMKQILDQQLDILDMLLQGPVSLLISVWSVPAKTAAEIADAKLLTIF